MLLLEINHFAKTSTVGMLVVGWGRGGGRGEAKNGLTKMNVTPAVFLKQIRRFCNKSAQMTAEWVLCIIVGVII